MDRGARQATVHGIAKLGHNLVTKERERETSQISGLFVNWLSSLKFFSVARNKILFFPLQKS